MKMVFECLKWIALVCVSAVVAFVLLVGIVAYNLPRDRLALRSFVETETKRLEASYRVDSATNQLVFAEGVESRRHLEIFQRVARLSRDPVHTRLSGFLVIKPNSGGEDLAYVVGDMTDAQKAVLGIRGYGPDLDTMIDWAALHEWGHILIAHPPVSKSGCLSSEKVSDRSRYVFIITWEERFWNHCVKNGLKQRTLRDYVSPYAMDNIAEDVAETWRAFVMCDRPHASKKRVRDEKVRMMWGESHLVLERTHMRKVLLRDDIHTVVLKALATSYCV
jgi:hypothetical protein